MPADDARQPTGPVDHAVLADLADRLGARGGEVRDALLGTWRTETQGRLSALAHAAAAHDVGEFLRVVHAMKGSSETLGATEIAAACAALERRLREGAHVDLPAAADDLRDLAERASTAFDKVS